MSVQIYRRLMRVLGARVFWSFALVTFLMAALLASVNMASRFALKDYVASQLEQTPWDFTVFETGGTGVQNLSAIDRVRSVEGVEQVESLALLRAKLPPNMSKILVDGKPFQTPWLTLIAASDMGLLPPQLQGLSAAGAGGREVRPVLALVGPESAMGGAFRALQGARNFNVQVNVGSQQASVYQTELSGVIRLDRDELSRWLMDQMGAPAYIPPMGAVLVMPYDPSRDAEELRNFDLLARGVVPFNMPSPSTDSNDRLDAQHEQKGEYVPEVIYLARVNRGALLSGWDVETSLHNINDLTGRVVHAVSAKGSSPGYGGPVGTASSGGNSNKSGASSREYAESAQGYAKQDFGRGGFTNAFYTQATPTGDAANRPVELVPVHGENEAPESGGGAEAMGTSSAAGSGFVVDSTTAVLLQQMQEMAQLIGIVTLLVAIPLLWMGWMLASNLSGLLMLNERRKLGLMRLRGVPGRQLGRTLLAAVSSGGFLGGVLGISLASVVLLSIYEGGRPPLQVLFEPQQLLLFALFLLITVSLTLLVSSKLIKYGTTISPLEASGRFASSESEVTSVKFGVWQLAALVVGGTVLAGWIFDFSIVDPIPSERLRSIGVVFDFLALPLFLYGLVTLLASRRSWIEALMAPLQGAVGGNLSLLSKRHMAAKPHRTVVFLMIMALMASITLYPTIAGGAFEDKTVRGAQVQIGADWHFTFNSPDLTKANSLRGPLGEQMSVLGPQMESMVQRAQEIEGVQSVEYMVEAFLPSVYVPGAGTSGVPVYVLGDAIDHKNELYGESELGIGDTYEDVLQGVQDGGVALSPAVAEFWEPAPEKPMRLGVDSSSNTVWLPSAGVLGHLPGMPPRSVTDRKGYVQARVDYLNYLFDEAAYMAVSAENPDIQDLQVFVPRTVLLVRVEDGVAASPARAEKVQQQLTQSFPLTPLEMHTLPEEIRKVGSDMFVTLALENMKIYLVGGLILAIIAIFAVAMANYAEDKRTLALLRIRGTSPKQLRRFIATLLISPGVLGLILGVATALIAGFGLTNRVWALREIRSVVQLLNTHLVISQLAIALTIGLLGVVIVAAWLIGRWTFQRSATEL